MIKIFKRLLGLTIPLGILFCFYIFLYQIYSPRVNAFGCFDDCFNYLGGFFLLKGKRLYSQIFFNHQPLMAYISLLVQALTRPINIYELVLRHRQLVMIFGFLMNSLLIARFGLIGLMFAIFYELPKFYLFGDRFLAEGLVVYPLVHLTGLVWYKFNGRKIYSWEYILAAVFVWFVVFNREPYILLALTLYLLLVWGKWPKNSLSIFIGLSIITFLILSPGEYLFDLVIVNLKAGRFSNINLLKSFIYPVTLLFGGKWNIFRNFLVGIDFVFLILTGILLVIFKKIKLIGIISLLLGLANLITGEPGKVFYEAFHLLPWYGIFLWSVFLLLLETFRLKRKIGFIFFVLLIFIFSRLIFSSQFWIYEKINPHEEFMTNFGNELQVGEVIKVLSKPSDTLFLDGFDDLIYWQADRVSSYKYSWYTSFMPNIPKFTQARLEMFVNQPPDFYYGSCPGKEVSFWIMPESVKEKYQPIYSQGKPTCVYIRKDKILQIPAESWLKAKELLYELPAKKRTFY